MIIVHGTIPILEDQRDRALDLAREMSEATQTEQGCISYDFYIGLRDPNTLMLFQEWENMDALMGHFQTDHMETFLKELPSVAGGEITTRRFAVQSVDEEDDDIGDDPDDDVAPRVVH
jgi:quinol monooxygenase YgiN